MTHAVSAPIPQQRETAFSRSHSLTRSRHYGIKRWRAIYALKTSRTQRSTPVPPLLDVLMSDPPAYTCATLLRRRKCTQQPLPRTASMILMHKREWLSHCCAGSVNVEGSALVQRTRCFNASSPNDRYLFLFHRYRDKDFLLSRDSDLLESFYSFQCIYIIRIFTFKDIKLLDTYPILDSLIVLGFKNTNI